MKVSAGLIAGGGVGFLALLQAIPSPKPQLPEPKKLTYTPENVIWPYIPLDPMVSAERAYRFYPDGSCMYATVLSIVSQLAEQVGDPYTHFPSHLFRYGHGGVGGYGSICGALNGSAAVIGMLITDKNIQDSLIADLFQWYETTPLPHFAPKEGASTDSLPESISQSVLCHASNTKWCEVSGFSVSSKERKERCRRLTADVSYRLTVILNALYAQEYLSGTQHNTEAASCMACHGSEGKLDNTAVKMNCNSCHTESLGHKLFSEAHYQLIKE